MCFSTRVGRYPSLECLALGEVGLVSQKRSRALERQIAEGLVCTYISEHTRAVL